VHVFSIPADSRLQPVTAHGHDFAMRDFLTEQLR
jgi:hypothetical protein